MQTIDYKEILSHFQLEGTVSEVKPLGNGLINDTLKVNTTESDKPDYVLQRINNAIFTDVEMLQHNIQVVTTHIRHKLEQQGASDIDRKVLHFLEAENGKTYYKDAQDRYWRVMVFIPGAKTYEAVTPEYSYYAGVAFGDFEKMLVDVPEQLGETIPNFHNLELRLQQLRDVVATDPVGRVKEEKVQEMLGFIEAHADEMCKAERLHREGKLPKRICHCDTKVNNMMFDENGHILCVIDLDTVMPSYIFSDYGDFLTPVERENLPYAVALFPFMQSVRFLWDYISGDHYWKCKYPEHNLDRARNQLQLYKEVRAHDQMMQAFVG